MLMMQLIIIQVITFVGLVFVLRKIMYSASIEETKRLKILSEQNEQKAQQLQSHLALAQEQFQETIQKANEESRRLKEEAQDQANRVKEEVINKAKEESDRILKQAFQSKDQIRQEVQQQMQQTAISRAMDLIKEVLGAKRLLLLHKGLLEGLLEELGNIDPGRLTIDTQQGRILSPVAVDAADKQKIISILSSKIGKPITLQDTLDASLIAGISIKLGSLVIDGSLAEKLREASVNIER